MHPRSSAQLAIKKFIVHSWLINLSGEKASLIGGFFLLFSVLVIILFPPNTDFNQSIYDLEISQDHNAGQITRQLSQDQVIDHAVTFKLAAWLLGYKDPVKPGLFQVTHGWSNWQLIKHLKTTPPLAVEVVIHPYQMRNNTLQSLCKNLDIKYHALKRILQDESYLSSWGSFNTENVYSVLFADTLLMYRHSRAGEVADRLFRNYQYFWTPERMEQAAILGLTPQESVIMASIVYAETKIAKEMPIIAGLYLNRINRAMRLQADPTVVYAAGRPLRRVLRAHQRIRSKYNTYRINGLPPGPVHTPTRKAIEAVLQPQSHDYIYFCARHDLSGYHHFSRTLEEHQDAARKYQNELNKRRIGFSGP